MAWRDRIRGFKELVADRFFGNIQNAKVLSLFACLGLVFVEFGGA